MLTSRSPCLTRCTQDERECLQYGASVVSYFRDRGDKSELPYLGESAVFYVPDKKGSNSPVTKLITNRLTEQLGSLLLFPSKQRAVTSVLEVVKQSASPGRLGRRSLLRLVRPQATIEILLHAQPLSVARLRLRDQHRRTRSPTVAVCSFVRRQRHRQRLCGRRNARMRLLLVKQRAGGTQALSSCPARTASIQNQAKRCGANSSQLCSSCPTVQVLWSESLQHASGDGLGPGSQITSIAFLPGLDAVCIAATSGELLLTLTSREVQEASRPTLQANTSIAAPTEHWYACRLVSSRRVLLAVHGAPIKSSWQSAPGTGTWFS